MATDDYDERDADWLRDHLRQRDRDVSELRSEIDGLRDLIQRFEEHADDYNDTLESWRQTFQMELNADGAWTWEPFWDLYQGVIDRYTALRREWNRFVPEYNAAIAPQQNIGRPLAASDAQVATVRKLHKAGKSLRWIVEETSLSLRTVRTIIGMIEGNDRTTRQRRQRIERIGIDKMETARWKSQKRSGDALPKRVQTVIDQGNALVKEAKGLGRT